MRPYFVRNPDIKMVFLKKRLLLWESIVGNHLLGILLAQRGGPAIMPQYSKECRSAETC